MKTDIQFSLKSITCKKDIAAVMVAGIVRTITKKFRSLAEVSY